MRRLAALAQILYLETLCTVVFWYRFSKEILRYHQYHVSGLKHALHPQSMSYIWAATGTLDRECKEGPAQSLYLLVTWRWKCCQEASLLTSMDFFIWTPNSESLTGPLSRWGENISKTRQKTLKQAPRGHCIYFAFSV